MSVARPLPVLGAVLGAALGALGAAAPGAARAAACPVVPVGAAASPFGYVPGAAVIAPGGPLGTVAPGPPAGVPSPADSMDIPVEASAARVTSEDGTVTLEGGVRIDWAGRSISADSARYVPDTGEIDSSGALVFEQPGVRLSSANARVDLDDERFEAGATSYRLDVDGRRATGDAAAMRGSGEGRFELEDATYSTCPPEQLDWFFRADRIDLDTEAGIGTARGIALRFKGVPVFALPAFSFPVGSKRKTGFLAPAVARSDETGFELLLPWYWNIRPELDATFVPRLMTKRGLQLQSELRWLNPRGAWTLDHELLRDTEIDDWRSYARLNHAGTLGTRWRTAIDYATVSDEDYFDDLGNSLQRASITHLEQRAEIAYEDVRTFALARVQRFQTVDPALDTPIENPYRRVPQVLVGTESALRPFGLRGRVDGEFVYFDRSDSVTGARVDVAPRLSLPLSGDAWFVEPAVSWRLTHYGLDDGGPDDVDSATRTLPTASLDAGLFFDRALDERGGVQTLEPRLYYLRVPYEDQSALPVFDTSAFDFNFSQLFRENRYSGPDRIADADQLSVALTTRIIDGDDGRESLSASIGQILYFDERRVTLPDERFVPGVPGIVTVADPERAGSLGDADADRSDLVAEVSTRLVPDWLAAGSLQWNPDDDETVRGSALISYRPAPDRLLNLAHRVVSTGSSADTEQLDVSFAWPLSGRLAARLPGAGGGDWRLAGRWNYSLDADLSLETLVGLEYDSCCWALRAAARRYISDDGEDHDNSFYLQLVLKGLAPVGQDYGTVLENAILGYRDTYR